MLHNLHAPKVQNIDFLFPQGSAATQLRRGGQFNIGFVGNLVLFAAVKEFWKSIKNWQSYGHDQGGTLFIETQLLLAYASGTDVAQPHQGFRAGSVQVL